MCDPLVSFFRFFFFFCFFFFCCFFCFFALFIDLLTDKVQPLSRCMTNNGGMTLRALETLLGVDSTDLAKHLTPMVRGKYKYVCSMLVVSLMVLVQHRSLDTLDLYESFCFI